MQKTWISVCTVGALLTAAVATAQEAISISTGEYPPGLSEYSPHYGYSNHIVAEAFALEGREVELHFAPWKRAYEDARAAHVEATCCWFYTEERQKDFYASSPIMHEGFYFYHLKSFNFQWQSLDDLAGLVIGGSREYSYTDAFYQAVDEGRLNVDWVGSDLQSLRKLLAGRVDVVPIDTAVGEELIRSNFSPEIQALFTYHPKPLLDSTTHLLFPKTGGEHSKALLEQFNRGLQQLRDSGRYDEILEAVFAGDYKTQEQPWRPEAAE